MFSPYANPGFSPLTTFIGEQPSHPTYETSPGGGVTIRRELLCFQADVFTWMLYFLENPIDPYCLTGNLWKMSQRPFEKQIRTAANLALYGPAIANYPTSLISLEYESAGMRFFPGAGLVKEEQRPRLEQVPVGVLRTFSAEASEGTLGWVDADSNDNYDLYYGEHPHCEVGGREIILTFPFAPSGAEPFGEGSVNSDAFTLFVTGDVCPPGTLKYMGCAKEASVVIPAVGIYTGLVRYRKSFIFHYLNANIGPVSMGGPGDFLTWNTYWRARDQNIGQMNDMDSATYLQFTPESFSSINWFL